MEAIYSLIRNSLNDLGLGKSLDVGCGVGGFLSTLKNGIGVELSKERARMCKHRKLEVIVADANHLPFKDRIFEFVTCIEVVEHTCTPYSVLHEIHLVLKKGGRLFLSTPNLAGPVWVLYQMIKRRSYAPAHRFGFDPYLLCHALSLANFKIVNLTGTIVAHSNIFLPLSRICTKLPNLATTIIAEGITES